VHFEELSHAEERLNKHISNDTQTVRLY